MPKKRYKTRMNRQKEKTLDRKNAYGIMDLTPVNAVKLYRGENNILLK